MISFDRFKILAKYPGDRDRSPRRRVVFNRLSILLLVLPLKIFGGDSFNL